MKKSILMIAVMCGWLTSARALPDIALSMWKCAWNNDRNITADGNTCHFEHSMTCSHWLWGSRTTTYEWSRPCNLHSNNSDNDIAPYDGPYDIIGIEADLMAHTMNTINASGIAVPPQFMDKNIIANDSVIRRACFNFRMALAGYDVNDPLFFETCYIPTTTLPIQVPLVNDIPLSLTCLSISPNPVSQNLNIKLNGLENYITNLRLVHNGTGLKVYELFMPFQPTISIDVSNFPPGFYSLIAIHEDEVFSTLLNVIN